jgi:hypothetical protein
MLDTPHVPPGVDPNKPAPARLYDYYLGGSTNLPVDREAAERIRADLPEISDIAWANRGFHQRAARWLAAERGIRQFIDIGSGLPTQGNTHEVIQNVSRQAKVAYVDSDPMVIAYARELLTDDQSTAAIHADLRDPDGLLGHPDLRALIDFSQPTGLLMTAVLHFVADSSDPWGLVARYVRALAPGSYLAVSHATADNVPSRGVQTGLAEYAKATENIYLRPRAQVARFFEGLELEPPYKGGAAKLVFMGEWGAEDLALADSDGSRWGYCGVARIPGDD